MRRSFMLSIAAVAIMSVLCSGVWAGEVKNLSALSGQEEQHKWADGNTYVVDADLEISDRITVNGSVTLILRDGCTLSADEGINVSEGNELIITTPSAPGGTGILKANTKKSVNAAIGGGPSQACGTITITGGTVTAASTGGAGIGSGVDNGSGVGGVCDIKITGGTVTATSTGGGAGIGSGACSGGNGGSGVTVTINGGTVTATSYFASGIGDGYNGTGSTLSSDTNGWAWMTASRVGAATDNFNGMIFDESDSGNGKVYGTASVSGDVAIPSGKTLEIPDGASLTIRNGATLDASKGTLANAANKITNDGTVKLPTGTDIKALKLIGSGTVEMNGVKYDNKGLAFHTVTVTPVTPGSNGMASADLTEAASGDLVKLLASPDVGYLFDGWETVPASLIITGREHASFTMPDEAVEVKATFKALPPGEYAIIVDNDGHGTGTADPSVASKDIIVTLSPSPDPGYEFDAWIVVNPTSLKIEDDKFTMPDEAVTVKATFKALPTPSPTPDPSPMPPAPTPSYTPGKYNGAIDRDRSDTLWDSRVGGDMTIHIDVDLDQFTQIVSLDEVPLAIDTIVSNDFGARRGSAIVTIWEKTLKDRITTDGEHTAEVGFADGTAIHTFTVRGTGETPPQKTNTSGGACASGAAVVVGLIGLAAIKRRKK